VNWLIQSSGRDIRVIAVGELWPALDRFLGLYITGLVHDETLLKNHDYLIAKVKQVVLKVMTSDRLREMFYGDIPLRTSVKTGDSWGSAHCE